MFCFGARSTTDDLEGALRPSDSPAPTRDEVASALETFTGEIEQVPPDYSAVRVAGRKAYELARHGEKPELRPRRVTVSRLDLTDWDDSDAARPVARVEMACSAGTYVRAVARDLGDKLGCGAYLGALTRTASGPFRIEQAHSLDEVRAALTSGRAHDLLLPMDAGLEFPELRLNQAEVAHLARGQQLRRAMDEGLVRVFDESGRLVAIARAANGTLQPEKVFAA